MPRLPTRKLKSGSKDKKDEFVFDDQSPSASQDSERENIKRKYPEDDDEDDDFRNEMFNVIQMFGKDLQKNILAKKKRMQEITQNSMNSNNDKMNDIRSKHLDDKKKASLQYTKETNTFIAQMENDATKIMEQEEKLANLMQQQQKLLQQQRNIQQQRLKSFRTAHERYMKEITELDQKHNSHLGHMNNEWKKDLAAMQKKMMSDMRQQEIASIRKSLSTMF